MSTRRHPMRPAPWKYGAWKDAPVLLTLTIPAAAIAEPGTVPNDLRSFQVGVFPRRRGGYEAYTRDFCADWAGCCVHGVSASSGAEAKVIAVQEHKERCVTR